MTSGSVFTFNVKGLQLGRTTIECKVLVSRGDGILTSVPSTGTVLEIVPPPASTGQLNGQVIASKPVTIEVLNPDHTLAGSVVANLDGTFTLSVSPGNYTVIATARGFLSAQTAQGTVAITSESTTTWPTIHLLTGDINSDNVIDPFDAMTIGMNYNTATPAAADLNNDGIINVLDLELLAANYREIGPIAWQ